MTVEMLGARIMAPYFGGSISVWGSLITVFMLALSVGYLIGGRLSTRNPNPKTFALFFIGAAISSIPIIIFADAIMRPIFLMIEDPRYGSLFASIFLYFIPTSILGMISPYSVRLMVDSHEHSGHMAGLLFFVSTIGSAGGTLATSFYFVLVRCKSDSLGRRCCAAAGWLSNSSYQLFIAKKSCRRSGFSL